MRSDAIECVNISTCEALCTLLIKSLVLQSLDQIMVCYRFFFISMVNSLSFQISYVSCGKRRNSCMLATDRALRTYGLRNVVKPNILTIVTLIWRNQHSEDTHGSTGSTVLSRLLGLRRSLGMQQVFFCTWSIYHQWCTPPYGKQCRLYISNDWMKIVFDLVNDDCCNLNLFTHHNISNGIRTFMHTNCSQLQAFDPTFSPYVVSKYRTVYLPS